MVARNFELAPIPRLSYNQWQEMYGGTMEDFSIHSLAYMLQCRQGDIDGNTRVQWESKLTDTIYNVNREIKDDEEN
jgi:hypothetical protein